MVNELVCLPFGQEFTNPTVDDLVLGDDLELQSG
jgi:hypothetical protein